MFSLETTKLMNLLKKKKKNKHFLHDVPEAVPQRFSYEMLLIFRTP